MTRLAILPSWLRRLIASFRIGPPSFDLDRNSFSKCTFYSANQLGRVFLDPAIFLRIWWLVIFGGSFKVLPSLGISVNENE